MTIGLRTIKTAISATAAIFFAQQLNLLNPASAGIIALLSVTATKKSTIRVGIERILALTLAIAIASLIFSVLGFHALAFGIYLLIFIMFANYFKLNEGIPVSSVLVSQFLMLGKLSTAIILNAYLLLILGVGCALIANLYMPNKENKLKQFQGIIDNQLTIVLETFADMLESKQVRNCPEEMQQLKIDLQTAENWAKKHAENFIFSDESYYVSYFSMRKLQVDSLDKMNGLIERVPMTQDQGVQIADLLRETVIQFSEDNDGVALLAKLHDVLDYYRQTPLPKDREEFEYRAVLFQFLNEFEHFLEIKKGFFKF